MGYHLRIGEMLVDVDYERRSARAVAGAVDGKDLGAPMNSSQTYENGISPSYTAWYDFCVIVGLACEFYGDGRRHPYWKDDSGDTQDGILLSHPGCEALTEQLYSRFAAAQKRYEPDGPEDWNKIRLDWLVWWARWALDNCKYPSFANC